MRYTVNRWLLSLAVSGMVFSGAAGQKMPATGPGKGDKSLPLDTAVRHGKLPNGFEYFIRHNEHPQQRVIMYLVTKAGSVLEDDDQQGLAHFMEHMNFNGTAHFQKNQLVDYLQKAGVSFGADLNAYTAFDETVYQLPLPSDKPELVSNGLKIMHDWSQFASLDADEIDKERGVILEEMRLGKGVQDRLKRTYWPVILNNSRYSERSPIGTEEVLKNFKPEVIRRFHRDWYRPDLQALIVVGDIDAAAIEKQVKRDFADLKNPVPERPRTKYSIALDGKNRFIAATDKEMTETVIEVLIKHPAENSATDAGYRKLILHALFNQMLGSRFTELNNQPDPPYYRSSAGIRDFLAGLKIFDVETSAKPGRIQESFVKVWKEIVRLQRFGFTQTELDRAKGIYINRMQALVNESSKTDSRSYVQEYLQYFTSGIPAPGINREMELVKQAMPTITLADLQQLARDYISSRNRDVMILAAEKDKGTLPGEAEIQQWMKEAENSPLTPYEDHVSDAAFLLHPPLPGKIVKEQRDDKLGITTLTLSNGLKVLLKPTAFKNDEVLFNSYALGGTSIYSDQDFESASGANIIPSFGAGNFDRIQLNKHLAGKQVFVQPYISDLTQGVKGGASGADLETALQLTYAYLTEPRIDSNAFLNLLSGTEASIINRNNDPETVFADTISNVLANYNVRKTAPTLEKLDQMDLGRALAIYREMFGNAQTMTFVFTGSIDQQKIKPLLEKYLGALPASNTTGSYRNLHINPPVGKIERTIRKGIENKATVKLVFSGPFDYSFRHQLQLQAMNEVLQIRLLERLREAESGAYTPRSISGAVKYPDARYSISVSFGCSPANANRLIVSALDEIGQLRANGPSKENLQKFKAEAIRKMETEINTNAFWISYITAQLQNNDDPCEILQYNDILNAITTEDIKQMADACLNENNYLRFVLLPQQ